MQLEDLAVVIRPRNPWEAIDLGFGIARRWWRTLYLPWLCVLAPLFAALNLLFTGIPWMAPLIIWWLKPFFDRLILYVLSRAIFGHPPTLAETMRQIPNFFFTGLLAHLTWLRFDLIRSFRLPVMQLEALSGKPRRERVRVLQQRARNNAVWLTVVCIHLESFLYLSLFAFSDILLPQAVNLDAWELLTRDAAGWENVLLNLFAVIPMLLIEPAYVAGGFALYLNRRTEIEGWDIEIEFRKLAGRLAARSAPMLLALAFVVPVLMAAAPEALAAATEVPVNETRRPPEDAHEVIDEVLTDEVFGRDETVQVWRFKSQPDDVSANPDADLGWLGAFGRGLALLFEILLWIGGAVLLYLFVKTAWRWYQGWQGERKVQPAPAAASVAGMVIAPDSLPENIPASVLQLWGDGSAREALSLLYRGTLVALIERKLITLPASATEGDVLRLARPNTDAATFGLLDGVTLAWQQLAYAHRSPPGEQVTDLCASWDRVFGGPA